MNESFSLYCTNSGDLSFLESIRGAIWEDRNYENFAQIGNNIASDTLKSTVSIGLSYANKVAK
ncbi:hypothetical protein [Anaplasma phagocytophilum]|uniref:hypothetical protein n=1 Tax=Anaplasma phagocytophilum TaxID=948 RepID=UPI000427F8D4|nr:hypothetical protein [Anaplasma phagocytophilum]